MQAVLKKDKIKTTLGERESEGSRNMPLCNPIMVVRESPECLVGVRFI
jgi:hypothetical protein